MRKVEELENGYRCGPFVFSVSGTDVIVTKDDSHGLFNSIRVNSYKNEDAAWNAAYRQAVLNR